jgi:hypothetical protein
MCDRCGASIKAAFGLFRARRTVTEGYGHSAASTPFDKFEGPRKLGSDGHEADIVEVEQSLQQVDVGVAK